jgi:sulfatase modifying factor 1
VIAGFIATLNPTWRTQDQMKRLHLYELLALVLASGLMLVETASALVTIDSVYVGDIGNPNDPTTGFGGVNYGYAIGKYEVTLIQYTEFLNAVGATDTYGLYNPNMASNLNIAGIAQDGTSGSYTYSVIGSGSRPVAYVSWFDSARFVNWLHNGQPVGAQGAGTTETGAYTLNGAVSGLGFTRNVNATYGLPSENEWYKAAYYQPAAQGGNTLGYWLYPTASNATPNSRNGSASDPNSANFYRDDGIANGFNGGFAVTQTTMQSVSENYLTDAGAFSLANSFYGTFDQGGNVFEWNDAVIVSSRGVRGGSLFSTEAGLRTFTREGFPPTSERNVGGFRVVILPVLKLTQAGNVLTFSWAGNFKLQSQTNSLSSGVGVNWSDYPSGGSSPVDININPGNPSAFFRLSPP